MSGSKITAYALSSSLPTGILERTFQRLTSVPRLVCLPANAPALPFGRLPTYWKERLEDRRLRPLFWSAY